MERTRKVCLDTGCLRYYSTSININHERGTMKEYTVKFKDSEQQEVLKAPNINMAWETVAYLFPQRAIDMIYNADLVNRARGHLVH